MGIRINFTDTEKYSGSSLGLDPLPTGKYHVAITDAEIREAGPNAKNPGSQYINFEFTVQEGPYQGRKVWTNASLLPQALYTIKGILEALGHETTGNELDIELDELMNEELIVKVMFLKAAEVNGRSLDDRNEVKRFYKLGTELPGGLTSGTNKSGNGKSSLLP
jgi:hypothetical protein